MRLRLFCVDHRPDGAINPLGLTTVGVGQNRQPGILHDDVGENIAAHNPHLNESTALWWLWRHPEVRRADFVGLCHYRRFLLFRPLPDRRGRVSSRLGGVFLKPSLQALLPISLSLSEAWLRDPGAKVSRREPGFITEFLVGTYWRWLEETGQARFSHCQCVAFLRNGHGRWYLPFSRWGFRYLPDGLAAVGSHCHRWLVKARLLPHP